VGDVHVPTPDERSRVERLAALGVSQREIARVWLRVSKNTLRKRYSAELRHGRERAFARLKMRLIRSAEVGSVMAQLFLLQRFFADWLPPMPPRKMPAEPMPAERTTRTIDKSEKRGGLQ
jgi:hypothetical protein